MHLMDLILKHLIALTLNYLLHPSMHMALVAVHFSSFTATTMYDYKRSRLIGYTVHERNPPEAFVKVQF